MLQAAEEAVNFSLHRSRIDLDNDRQFQFALVRCIEIIGEAASRMSEATRSVHPQLPWARMVSARNRLVHVYFDVDLDIVWQTVTGELPTLIREVRQILHLD